MRKGSNWVMGGRRKTRTERKEQWKRCPYEHPVRNEPNSALVNLPPPRAPQNEEALEELPPGWTKETVGKTGMVPAYTQPLISFRPGSSAIWDVSSRCQRAFLCQLKASHTENTSWTFEMPGSQEWNLDNCSPFSSTFMEVRPIYHLKKSGPAGASPGIWIHLSWHKALQAASEKWNHFLYVCFW